MKKFFAAAAILLASMSASFAGGLTPVLADPVVIAPAAESNWSGAYVGGTLGYGKIEASNGVASESKNAASVGVFGGYRYDLGNVVIGGELGLGLNKVELAPGIDQDQTISLRATLGTPLNKDTLVYGAVGLVNTRISAGPFSERENGLQLGLGLERKISSKISVGGEITHSKFSNFANSGVDLKDTRLNARVSYNF